MLTERIVRDAKSDGKARTIWDTEVTGLGLQITQGGKKNYVLRYRAGGRKRQAILCRVGGVSLRAIRNLSTTLRHRRFLFTDSFLLLWKWRVG